MSGEPLSREQFALLLNLASSDGSVIRTGIPHSVSREPTGKSMLRRALHFTGLLPGVLRPLTSQCSREGFANLDSGVDQALFLEQSDLPAVETRNPPLK